MLYVRNCDLLYALPTERMPQTLGGQLPEALAWASPEIKKGGWSVLKEYGALRSRLLESELFS